MSFTSQQTQRLQRRVQSTDRADRLQLAVLVQQMDTDCLRGVDVLDAYRL